MFSRLHVAEDARAVVLMESIGDLGGDFQQWFTSGWSRFGPKLCADRQIPWEPM